MKVLITGGAGFIGSHLAEYFSGQAEVWVLDDLRTGKAANLDGLDVHFVRGSVRDETLVAELMKGTDYVFHMAAMVSVPESMEQPVACVDINCAGTVNVLQAAARAGVRKLCFSSSSAVYGDDPEQPKREQMAPQPRSPYAVSKLSGEYYCKMYTENGDLPAVSLRYFNVFGPRQDPNSPYAAAVPALVTRALKGQPIRIYGDGEQTRDFVFVKDVVAANVHFALHTDAVGVYNVARGNSMTINQLAGEIVTVTGATVPIEHTAERPGDVKHSSASVERLAAAGFTASTGFGTALQQTIEYFRGAI
jgi:UDP-glucose 4-epimerase